MRVLPVGLERGSGSNRMFGAFISFFLSLAFLGSLRTLDVQKGLSDLADFLESLSLASCVETTVVFQ